MPKHNARDCSLTKIAPLQFMSGKFFPLCFISLNTKPTQSPRILACHHLPATNMSSRTNSHPSARSRLPSDKVKANGWFPLVGNLFNKCKLTLFQLPRPRRRRNRKPPLRRGLAHARTSRIRPKPRPPNVSAARIRRIFVSFGLPAHHHYRFDLHLALDSRIYNQDDLLQPAPQDTTVSFHLVLSSLSLLKCCYSCSSACVTYLQESELPQSIWLLA